MENMEGENDDMKPPKNELDTIKGTTCQILET